MSSPAQQVAQRAALLVEHPEIRLHEIDKRYGDRVVLEKFSMEIAPGEFVTAIGSSGSGKTTVLKLINGLLTPDSGQIFIHGQDIATLDQNKLRRSIGYVIQEVGLFPHMKIKDNISYVLELNKAGKNHIRKRLKELLEIVQLDAELLSRYPHELSGGQKQRVGLARALAAEPRIILMDEPFGALDDITRKGLQAEIKRIQQQIGVTIFFITHDITEALLLGSRVMVMNNGVIEQFDTPDAIKNYPATDFVEELVGNRECP